MDPVRNPFAPGAGTPPPELAGRSDIIARAETTFARIRERRPSKSFLFVGLRGVGKTVLLNRMQEISEAQKYKTMFVEATEEKPLPALLYPYLRQLLLSLDRMENLNEHVKRGLRVLRSFANSVKVKYEGIEIGLDIDPEAGTADSGDLEADLSELMLAVAEASASRKIAVALIIDEMQYLSEIELSALIMAIHRINQKQFPLILIGAGLPQLVGLTGKSKSYAERLFDFPRVGPLATIDAQNALQGPVRREGVEFSDDALGEIIRITEGYPYFLQEWGYHAWNLASASPIEIETVRLSHKAVTARLDESFFQVRFDRLTPSEKGYLRAMADLPSPRRSGDIAALLGVQGTSVAPRRSALIKKGMIYSPAHGDTEFTVPLFDQFMKRIMPNFERHVDSASR
jgi:hypothetical protein